MKFLKIRMNNVGELSEKDVSDKLIRIKHHERVDYVKDVFDMVRTECDKKVNDLKEELNEVKAENNRKMDHIEVSFDAAQTRFLMGITGLIKNPGAEEEYQRKIKIISNDLDKIIDGYYEKIDRIKKFRIISEIKKSLPNVTNISLDSDEDEK